MSAEYDFDVHGIVGVRLVDPTPRDVATVRKQLGRLSAPLGGTPDIFVRFVKRLDAPKLSWVDYGKSGFTEDGFYVTWIRKRPVRVRVDLSPDNGAWEIVCEHGVPAVPLLLHLVLLMATERDCVPLHASAFQFEGQGVLVCGWAKGGKTEALLAFAQEGARYIGDEWILVRRDGSRVYGIPENIRLWDWHLQQLPRVRQQIGATRRLAFAAIRTLDRLQRGIPLRLLREAMPALRRQANVQLAPESIFGEDLGPFRVRPDRLFLMLSHADDAISVEPTSGAEIAARMAASVVFEQLPFFQVYLAHRFAFPGRRNRTIEAAAERQAAILDDALATIPAWTVRHPYPVSLDALFEAMRPACVQRPASIDVTQRSV